MFSVSFENENITSKPFTYIGKNEGATALFFTVSLGPKNLFFLFFLSHATPWLTWKVQLIQSVKRGIEY